MDEFIQQYRLQMQFLLDQYLKLMEQDYLLEAKFNQGHMRIEDLFLDGTLDHAQTWIIGGVKYHKITMQGSGLATVIDSLAAINRAVYRDRRYTLEQLRTALAHDFIGHEEMRRYLLKLPKFGNDIDEVDAYAKVVVDAFADAVHRMNDRRTKLYTYMPTISTDRDFSIMGQSLAATANGRCAGDPVSENQSPTLGADRQGLTALLNSVSHIPFNRITGGPLNLRLHPTHIEGSEGLGKLSALLAVYMEKGGMQVQINVVGREQLLEAQTQPERYNNLCVRVTGYSAYFVQMGKIAQDELINRTEY
jgi:formate C-acetyltransferase